MISFFKKHLGAILLAAGILALGLGIVGFRTCLPTLSMDSVIYRSVQLFYWGYSPWDAARELPLPLPLAVARWLAPAVLFSAIFSVVGRVFDKQWKAWCIRRMRGHTIVCGAGEKGSVLIADLKKRGGAVVVVERSADVSKEGRLMITGDATMPEVLTLAGVAHATRLVALAGDDHENLAIAVCAAQTAGAASGLSVFMHSSDASLCDLYQRNRALTASVGGVPVRVFNHYRNVARRTLQDYPLNPGAGESHLVLPVRSRMSVALAVEYALVGHYPGDRRTHVHFAGQNAEADLTRLRAKYPSIDKCVHLHALEIHEGERFSVRVAGLVRSSPGDASFAICTGVENDNQAFGHALELHEQLLDRASVFFLLDTPPGAAVRRLVESNPELSRRICFLPTGEPASGYEAIIGESLDRTARSIHENWLAETDKQIAAARDKGDEAAVKKHQAKATYKPWDQLSEEQKGSNRSQADHIAFKIRAVGLDPQNVKPEALAALTDTEVEVLARLEHARWAAYYWMTGWNYAPQRNDAAKLHPNLVPYDELDDMTKEYDRTAVRHLADYLPQ